MQAGQAPSGSGPPPALNTGVVKSVLSGDTIVIRGVPRGGPPPEKTLALSNINAPRSERRPNPGGDAPEQKDEPFAWEAREFLRKMLVGNEITFSVEHKATSGTGREYGVAYLGKDVENGNIAEKLVAEGLAEVRTSGGKSSEYLQKLNSLQESAKAAGKGKWGTPEQLKAHVRNITWTQENPRNFLDSLHQKPQDAVIEHVRDGSTVRAFLLPSFNYVTVMLSGIKAPGFRVDNEAVEEPFAKEAQYFVESRLLQRDVQVTLESVSNNNFIGSVVHPKGNIAEALLKEGFAKCVDWSMSVVTTDTAKLRAAEKFAKDKKLRIWKNYEAGPGLNLDDKDKAFQAKVVEVVNGDALQVKRQDGSIHKIWLSSIRPPRRPDAAQQAAQPQGSRFRPLYDVPFMFEAREFMRKKIIGKKVNVTVDYIQPPSPQYPGRSCCTVTFGGQNLAEALLLKGLAEVVRYKAGDENRSSAYDLLMAAEEQAKKSAVGYWAESKASTFKVQDLSGDVKASKQFLPFLMRAGRSEAIVEFVASGSRLRCYVPKESCVITLLLSGINCPRAPRTNAPVGQNAEGEPYGRAALDFTKEICLQREVMFEVETMDRAGNFVGSVFVNGENLSLLLVRAGLASIHFTAERLQYYNALLMAEEEAKKERKGIWENGVPEVKEDEEEKENLTIKERSVKYTHVAVTHIDAESNHFFAQIHDKGPELEAMMGELRNELTNNPPLSGAYTPRKNDLCAARFSADNCWYRAKVENARNKDAVEVIFIDFGNKEITSSSKLAALPPAFHSIPGGAVEYALAFVEPPREADMMGMMFQRFNELVAEAEGQKVTLNTEYRVAGLEYVTLKAGDVDIGKTLIEDGCALVAERREPRFSAMVSEYRAAMESAKKNRLSIWRYGDFTGTEI